MATNGHDYIRTTAEVTAYDYNDKHRSYERPSTSSSAGPLEDTTAQDTAVLNAAMLQSASTSDINGDVGATQVLQDRLNKVIQNLNADHTAANFTAPHQQPGSTAAPTIAQLRQLHADSSASLLRRNVNITQQPTFKPPCRSSKRAFDNSSDKPSFMPSKRPKLVSHKIDPGICLDFANSQHGQIDKQTDRPGSELVTDLDSPDEPYQNTEIEDPTTMGDAMVDRQDHEPPPLESHENRSQVSRESTVSPGEGMEDHRRLSQEGDLDVPDTRDQADQDVTLGEQSRETTERPTTPQHDVDTFLDISDHHVRQARPGSNDIAVADRVPALGADGIMVEQQEAGEASGIPSAEVNMRPQSNSEVFDTRFEEAFITQMREWKLAVQHDAEEKIKKWAAHAHSIQKKNKHLKAQHQRDVTHCRASEAKISLHEEAIGTLAEQNKTLNELLQEQETNVAGIRQIYLECQQRLLNARACNKTNSQEIAGLAAQVDKVPSAIEKIRLEHVGAIADLKVVISEHVQSKLLLEEEVRHRSVESSEIKQSMNTLRLGWTTLNDTFKDLEESWESKLTAALGTVATVMEQAENEKSDQVEAYMKTIENLNSGVRADLIAQASVLDAIKDGVFQLVMRPSASEPLPLPDMDGFLQQIQSVLTKTNDSTVEKFNHILERLIGLSEGSTALSDLVAIMKEKDACMTKQQARIEELQSFLSVSTGDLQVTILEKQNLQKSNLHLINECNQAKIEAAIYQAGLADWKVQASMKSQQVDSLQISLSNAQKAEKVFQTNIQDLEESIRSSHDGQDVEPVDVEHLRQEIHTEMAKFIRQKEHDHQMLQDERCRLHANEMYRVSESLESIKNDHEKLTAHHTRVDSLYTSLCAEYKTMTSERDRLDENAKAREGMIGRAVAAKVTANQMREKAEQDLADVDQKHKELEQTHDKLKKEYDALKQQIVQKDKTQDQNESAQVQSLRQQLFQMESELVGVKDEASSKLEKVIQQKINLETQLEQVRATRTIASALANKQQKEVAEQALLLSQSGDEAEDEDEDETDVESADEVFEVQQSDRAIDHRPRTPLRETRLSSAVANSGMKRRASPQHSIPNTSWSQASTFHGSQDDRTSRDVRSDADSYPLDFERSKLSQAMTFDLPGFSQPQLSGRQVNSRVGQEAREPSSVVDRGSGKLPTVNKTPRAASARRESSQASPDMISKHTRQRSSASVRQTDHIRTDPGASARTHTNTPRMATPRVVRSRAKKDAMMSETFNRY
ncbi:Hypothetical protein D9617_4g002010 [Elsinoe fawcettii]|nr:Hypothetical protein D9617_4g002010 [Elsinoe fawcettii]